MSATRHARRRALVGTVAGAVLVVMASPAQAATDPAVWGATFCSETVVWLAGATQGAENLATQAADPSITPKQGKALLVDFLETGVDETKAFGQALKDAGAPDIANGAEIHASIVGGIAKSRGRLEALAKKARALSTKRLKKFEKGASTIGTQLREFVSPFEAGLGKADALDTNDELTAVLQTVPECAALNTAAGG